MFVCVVCIVCFIVVVVVVLNGVVYYREGFPHVSLSFNQIFAVLTSIILIIWHRKTTKTKRNVMKWNQKQQQQQQQQQMNFIIIRQQKEK